MNNEKSVTVLFMMWGQECVTRCDSEDAALQWLSACASKNWLRPMIVSRGDEVLHFGDALREKAGQ